MNLGPYGPGVPINVFTSIYNPPGGMPLKSIKVNGLRFNAAWFAILNLCMSCLLSIYPLYFHRYATVCMSARTCLSVEVCPPSLQDLALSAILAAMGLCARRLWGCDHFHWRSAEGNWCLWRGTLKRWIADLLHTVEFLDRASYWNPGFRLWLGLHKTDSCPCQVVISLLYWTPPIPAIAQKSNNVVKQSGLHWPSFYAIFGFDCRYWWPMS